MWWFLLPVLFLWMMFRFVFFTGWSFSWSLLVFTAFGSESAGHGRKQHGLDELTRFTTGILEMCQIIAFVQDAEGGQNKSDNPVTGRLDVYTRGQPFAA